MTLNDSNAENFRLSVFFDEPYWIGLCERESAAGFEVCKVTFGAEPTDVEVHAYFLENWETLQFSPAIESKGIEERKMNPKRRQRAARKEMQNTGIGTKAQQALKLQQEEGKLARKVRSREERDAERERKFGLRQEKRKEKHRGH